MPPDQIQLMVEADKRGILPPDKKVLLNEAVKRGLVPGMDVGNSTPDDGASFKNAMSSVSGKDYDSLSKDEKINLINENPLAFDAGGEQKVDVIGQEAAKRLEGFDPNALNALIQGFGDTYTAGLGTKMASGASSFANSVGDYLSGSDKDFSDLLEINTEAQKLRREQISKENPGIEVASNIAGLISPGGVLSQGMNLAKGVTQAPKLAGIFQAAKPIAATAGNAAVKGAPFLERMIKGLLSSATEGGISTAVYEGVNPETDIGAVPGLTAQGTAFNVGGDAVGKTLGYLGKALKNTGKAALKGVKNVGGKIPGIGEGIAKTAKELGEEKFASSIDDISKQFGVKGDPNLIGDEIMSGAKSALNKSSAEYDTIKKPLLEKFGENKVPLMKLKNRINSVLGEFELLGDAGDFVDNAFVTENDNIAKATVDQLNKILKSDDLTLNQVDKVLQSYGKKSIGSKPINKLFKKLHSSLRDDLFDSLEEGLVSNGVSGDDAVTEIAKFKDARKSISSSISASENFKKLAKKPEQLVSRGIRGSDAIEMIGQNPNLKEPIQKLVLRKLLDSSSDAKKLAENISEFGDSGFDAVFDPDTAKAIREIAGIKNADPSWVKSKLTELYQKSGFDPSVLKVAPVPFLNKMTNKNKKE